VNGRAGLPAASSVGGGFFDGVYAEFERGSRAMMRLRASLNPRMC